MADLNNNSSAIRQKTLMLAQLGVLIAVMIIFHTTGISYIKVGVFSLTIMAVPMIIGAITTGRTGGMVLGAVFGITTLLLPETQIFMSVNPLLAILLCVGARVLLGFLCAIIFECFKKYDKTKILSFGATGLLTSLLNTLFIIGGITLLFASNPSVLREFGMEGVSRLNFFAIFISLVGVQAVIEATVCTIISGVVAKAVTVYIK
ncbi:MAG: ECF transporter S component [Oscillospiraceae bacterium]|nr:ECF transporter S component [Oscillospiraceae bacterium]